MHADHLRPGDHVLVVGAEVASVLVEDDLVFVLYTDPDRPGEVFNAHDDLFVVREEQS